MGGNERIYVRHEGRGQFIVLPPVVAAGLVRIEELVSTQFNWRACPTLLPGHFSVDAGTSLAGTSFDSHGSVRPSFLFQSLPSPLQLPLSPPAFFHSALISLPSDPFYPTSLLPAGALSDSPVRARLFYGDARGCSGRSSALQPSSLQSNSFSCLVMMPIGQHIVAWSKQG